MPELQRPEGVECGNRRDDCRSREIVAAHHQTRLVAVQETPEDRPSDDAGEVEAEDDEAHRHTGAGQLQHEPEQGDDGELISKIRDAQPQPEPLERGLAQWSADSSGSRHEPMVLQSAHDPQCYAQASDALATGARGLTFHTGALQHSCCLVGALGSVDG